MQTLSEKSCFRGIHISSNFHSIFRPAHIITSLKNILAHSAWIILLIFRCKISCPLPPGFIYANETKAGQQSMCLPTCHRLGRHTLLFTYSLPYRLYMMHALTCRCKGSCPFPPGFISANECQVYLSPKLSPTGSLLLTLFTKLNIEGYFLTCPTS